MASEHDYPLTPEDKEPYVAPRFLFARRLAFRLAALVLVAVVPLFALGVWGRLRDRDTAVREAGAQAGRLARIAARNQEDAFREAQHLLAAIADAPVLRSGSEAERDAYLKDLLARSSGFVDFHLAKADGTVVAGARGAAASKAQVDVETVRRAVQVGGAAVGTFENGPDGKPVVHLAKPLAGPDGKAELVLGATLGLGWLEQFQSALQLPAGSVLEVVDPAGVLMLRLPDGSTGIGKVHPAIEAQRGTLPGDGRPLVAADFDGARRFFGICPLATGGSKKGYAVLVGIPEESVLGPANLALTVSLVASAIVLVVSLLLSQFMAERFVLQRVNGLILATKRLATTELGELRARAKICKDPSELGDLERSFDVMARALEDRAQELNRRATELDERAKKS
jgi:hypothetical protein